MLIFQKPFGIPLVVLLMIALMVGIFSIQPLLPATGAQSPLLGMVRAYPDLMPTDAVGRALLTAQSYGLYDKPDAIYIKKDTFSKFEEPNESWPLWDDRTVWAIRLDKRFDLKGRGLLAQSKPVDHIIVFIDELTGEFAGVRAGLELPAGLQSVEWIAVQESEIGNFPVGNADMPSEYYSKGVKSLPDPRGTPTPPKE